MEGKREDHLQPQTLAVSFVGEGSSEDAAETLSLWFKRKGRRVQSRRCTWLAGIRRRWRRRRRIRKRTVCRRVQFLEPLFTNRITAMHRDQKLLVMEYGGSTTYRLPPRTLVSSNQCTDKFGITVATQLFLRAPARCLRRKITGSFICEIAPTRKSCTEGIVRHIIYKHIRRKICRCTY